MWACISGSDCSYTQRKISWRTCRLLRLIEGYTDSSYHWFPDGEGWAVHRGRCTLRDLSKEYFTWGYERYCTLENRWPFCCNGIWWTYPRARNRNDNNHRIQPEGWRKQEYDRNCHCRKWRGGYWTLRSWAAWTQCRFVYIYRCTDKWRKRVFYLPFLKWGRSDRIAYGQGACKDRRSCLCDNNLLDRKECCYACGCRTQGGCQWDIACGKCIL